MYTKKRNVRFAVLSLEGREIEDSTRFCQKPELTRNYKRLLKKLNNKEIKAIILQPLNY